MKRGSERKVTNGAEAGSRRVAVCFLLSSFLIVTQGLSPASGQTVRRWDDPDGGDFNTGTHWENGIAPGTGDIAEFGLAGMFDVTFDADTTVYSLDVVDGATDVDVAFVLNGNTLTVTSTDTGQPALRMFGNRVDTLRLSGGTLDVTGVLRVGQTGTGTQTVVVGEDAVLNQRGDSRLANSGTGTIRVESNGLYQIFSNLNIGQTSGRVGNLVITGADARAEVEIGRTVTVGSSGIGTIEVLDGGRFDYLGGTGNRWLYLASGAGSSGTLRVDGNNSYARTTVLHIGGNNNGAGGTGVLQLSNGGHLRTLANNTNIRVYGQGSVEIDGGTMLMNSGLDWYEGSTYRLTLNAPADLPIDAAKGVNLAMASGEGTVLLELSLAEGFSGVVGQQYSALKYGGELTGRFFELDDSLANPEIEVDGYVFELDYGTGDNDEITLTLQVIPEPGTLLLLAAGLTAMAAARRRVAG